MPFLYPDSIPFYHEKTLVFSAPVSIHKRGKAGSKFLRSTLPKNKVRNAGVDLV